MARLLLRTILTIGLLASAATAQLAPENPHSAAVTAQPPQANPSSSATHAPVASLPQPSPAATPTKSHWYGGETLVVGLPAAGLLALGRVGEEGSPVGLLLGYPGVLLGAPIVHVAHAHYGKAFGSLFLQAASVVLFAGTLPPGDCPKDGDDPEGKACRATVKTLVPIGAIVGALVGTGLDAAFLAWEDVPVKQPAMATVAPQIAVSQEAIALAVSGNF